MTLHDQFKQVAITTISGAEAGVASESVPNQFGTSTLPFLLDDVGCNGLESNLLNCLPQHNCNRTDPENAGVHCLPKGVIDIVHVYYLQVNVILAIIHFKFISGIKLEIQYGTYQCNKQQHSNHSGQHQGNIVLFN